MIPHPRLPGWACRQIFECCDVANAFGASRLVGKRYCWSTIQCRQRRASEIAQQAPSVGHGHADAVYASSQW